MEADSVVHALELDATGWPDFRCDRAAVDALERRFLLSAGEILGAARHVTGAERDRLRVELLREEAMRPSAIEGEVLDPRSTTARGAKPAASCIMPTARS